MSIKEINNNGRSKIIADKTGSFASVKTGFSNKADSSAPSHNANPRPIADAFEEGAAHEATESTNFERGEDQYGSDTNSKKVLSDNTNTKI